MSRAIRTAAGLLVVLAAAGRAPAAAKGEDFYRFDELNDLVTLQGTRFYIPTVFGPTGASGWPMGGSLVVREVAPGSPAAGRLRVNDVLTGVNGRAFGDEPLKVLGEAVEASEQTGRMTLAVLRGGRKRSVELKLARRGAFGPDWPFDCAKSRRILREACAWLAARQNADGSFDTSIHVAMALDGLLMLAAEDPDLLDNCRRLAYWYRGAFDPASTDTPVWGWAYMGIFLAEYFRKTGDETVLPLCWRIGRTLARTQQPSGTWGHGPYPGEGYVQGGSMNPCGLAAWVALMEFREAGVPVSGAAIERARKFFARFADRGTVPYGNHRPEFAQGGNGKDALAAVAFAIAGDRARSEVFARLVTDWYRGRCSGHTGGFFGLTWGNVAGLLNPHRPDYRRMVDYWKWLLNVSRRWDGGFLLPESVIGSIYTNRGPLLATGGVASLFALPRKALRIHGGRRGIFGRKDLPENLAAGVRLYRQLRFEKLRRTVRPDSDDARELLAAAAAREKDIAHSLDAARRAMDAGDPLRAKYILEALEQSTGGRDLRVRELLREATGEDFAAIRAAALVYDRYKWLTCVLPEARRAFEKLAADPDAGIYRRLAREELDTPPDASKWSFYCELMWDRYSRDWRTNPISRAGVMRIASMKGGNWPRKAAFDQLLEAGFITNDFLRTWRALAPHGTAETDAPRLPWRHYPQPADGPEPPKNWAAVDFDDSAWKQGSGPVSVAPGEHLRIPPGCRNQYVRIPFDLKDPARLRALRLYFSLYRDWAKAVVYLNGTPVAWVVGSYYERYEPLDLNPAAVRLLRPGRNVLAVRAACYIVDVGLYGTDKAPGQ